MSKATQDQITRIVCSARTRGARDELGACSKCLIGSEAWFVPILLALGTAVSSVAAVVAIILADRSEDTASLRCLLGGGGSGDCFSDACSCENLKPPCRQWLVLLACPVIMLAIMLALTIQVGFMVFVVFAVHAVAFARFSWWPHLMALVGAVSLAAAALDAARLELDRAVGIEDRSWLRAHYEVCVFALVALLGAAVAAGLLAATWRCALGCSVYEVCVSFLRRVRTV